MVQSVLAPFDLQLGAFADIAPEALAIVADMLDDAHGPVIGEADGFAELALGAEQAVVLPSGWTALQIDRLWVRGQPMRLTARQGEISPV